MKVKVTCETADGFRNYTATAVTGKRKGEVVTARVYDCGHGAHLFWEKVKRVFGANTYTA